MKRKESRRPSERVEGSAAQHIRSKTSLKQQVYRALRREIRDGSLLPGDLLKERKLADLYGVSKTPVREALSLLEQENLVKAIPRAGYMVTQLALSDIQEVYQLRLALETTAIRLAVENITEQEIQKLEKIAHTSDPDRARVYNREFHSLVAWASGNSRLARIVEHLLDEMDRWIALDVRHSSPAVLLIGHQRELQALKTKDPDAAEEAMREHIKRVYQHLSERFF